MALPLFSMDLHTDNPPQPPESMPGGDRVGNDPASGELDSSFGSNGPGIGNETQH